MVPANAYGTLKTLSIRKMTPEAVAIMGRNVEKMPSALSIHERRGHSAALREKSVFRSKQSHWVIELVNRFLRLEYY